MVALMVLIVLTVIVAVGVGAVEISAMQVIHILTKQLGFGVSEIYDDSLRENVVMQIRLPRVFLGLLVVKPEIVLQGYDKSPAINDAD